MSGGKLEVTIGADITDFEKKIKEVEFDIKELSKVKLEKIKLGLDTTQINAQIKDAKNSLNSLKTAVKDTGGQIGGQFTKQVGNGSNTLMQFSRIAQDAPFGIMGIGNNITATAESFGYLKQQTGSTGGALKAMASSIMGTGGILLGVSLLTTGLTLLSQSGLTVSDIFNKLTGKFDEFGASINKIAIDSAKNSGQEIASLQALVSVAQNKTKSDKDRLVAVQELQNQYPGYFSNLTKEQILTGDLTAVTKELSKAIIARAEATAIADKIGELASKKLDLQIKKEAAILKLQQAQNNEKNKVTVTGGTLGAAGLSNEGRLASATATVKDLNQDIYDIQVQQDKLAGRLNQKTADSIKLLEKKATVEKAKVVKTFETPQVSGLQSSIIPVGLVISPIDTTAIKTAFTGIRETVSSELLATQELLFNFSEDIDALVVGSLGATFSNLGTAIGEALATGGNVFQAIGNSLLQSLGSFLSDMGDLLIKYGTLAIVKGKLDLAIATGGPVSIGAGIAAIAVGVLLKAAGGAIGAKAKGGATSGAGSTSTATGNGANNSSTSGGNFGWSGGGNGTVVFEIAGTSLIGVLNNTTERNLRIGGRS